MMIPQYENPSRSPWLVALTTSVMLATGLVVCWHLFKVIFDPHNQLSSSNERFAMLAIYPMTFLALFAAHQVWERFGKKNQQNKAAKENKQRLLIDADGSVARVDRAQNIIFTSSQACEILSPNKGNLMGRNISDLLFSRGVSKDDVRRFSKMLELQFTHSEYGLNFGDVWFALDTEKEQRKLNLKSLPVHDSKTGEILSVAIILKDISADKELMNRLHDQAEQDPLTGLPNRLGFNRFMELFPEIAVPKAKNVLCFLDLDKFKYVNDTVGHVAGDELLRQLAGIFNECIRSTDKLARIGGDEFVIMLPRCNIDAAKKVLQNIITRVAAHRFNWEDKSFVVGVSIGAIEFDSEVTASELRRLAEIADQACYVAKERGRNQLFVQDANASLDEAFKERDSWHDMIRNALDNDLFSLYVQPIIPLKSNKAAKQIRRYEVFIRMPHKGQVFLPGSFFPAAERYGMIIELDRWVVRHALKKISYILAVVDDDIRREFTINLSSNSLQDETFTNFIVQELNQSSVNASLLCFEFSESTLISHYSYARKLVTKLAILGCKTSLDDFGSGISSLNHLRDLPINYLKIDGVFVKNIETSQVDAAMIHALHHMCKVMKMETVAEYVETEKTAVLLRRLGVDYAQGYYCGKPLSMDRLTAPPVEISA